MNSSALPSTSASISTSTTKTPHTSALVSKFRCLFSHDIRRKAKRWHDGFLRFHSFNKRVMVYDSQNNFIGDLHWREGEELNDGDELELERGVLVQVGECVEKTQTDLTELLEKKRSHASVSSPANAFSPDASSRLAFAANGNNTAPNSSGRLKSLNELLGIRKTPIGRAALASRSPYEERHRIIRPDDRANIIATERAPKRQRVSSREQGRDVDRPSRQHPLRDSSSYSSVSNSLASFQPASDLALNSVSTSSKSSSRETPNTTRKGDRTKSQTTIDLTNPTGSVNTLRMTIEKPRKKLMYRDLLPGQAGQRPIPRSQQSSGETQSSRVRRQRDSRPQSPIEDRDPAAEIENIPPAGLPAFKPASTEINSTLHFIPSTSTLRALQESDPAPPPSSQRPKPINQFFKPSCQQQAPPIAAIKAPKNPSPPCPAVETPQTTTAAPTTTTTTGTTASTVTEHPPSRSPNRPQSHHRPFTRSHSDITPSLPQTKNSSHAPPPAQQINPPKPPTIKRSETLPLPLPITQPALAERSDPPPPPPEQKPTAPPPPKPLQKALSDASSVLGKTTTPSTTTTATATTATTVVVAPPAPRTRQSLLAPKRNQHVATCVDVDEEDQGPWTEEALDLFDWWPPGRARPERKGGKVGGLKC
ncbi:hypothetical protein EMPG_14092 [Blastomyces silverae]|uniref:5'-3' DNA helicase ZGRF1-like N-terminal domain-containing protein n=1 Tax=Blastomyces silverae TaxID=2060906 RepID=A0A0H1BGB5_9EURO|nr:hypothetical protein EMPG_14092 [Blastomyces silverae]